MKRLMIGIAALAALSACGAAPAAGRQVASLSTAPASETTPGTGDVTGTTAPKDPQDAALAFAKCMREHGIDMPDPNGDGGIVFKVDNSGSNTVGKGIGSPDDPKFQAAQTACKEFLPGKPSLSGGGTAPAGGSNSGPATNPANQ